MRICEHTSAEAMATCQDRGGATVGGERRLRKGNARGVEGSSTSMKYPSTARRPTSHGVERGGAIAFGSNTAHKAGMRPWLDGQAP
jgi:hypothetical protein